MRVEEIKIEDIVIPESRARATFTDEQYQELKASIEKNGFTVPILVKPANNGKFELIDGEHRIAIVKDLGWDSIPAVITDADEKKATLLNILANTARGTQNPVDVAEALRRAYDAGADVKELAAATGHTESWVKLYLTLTELPDVYKDALRDGNLKVGHIQEAMRLNDPVEIDAALESTLTHNWNVKVLRYYVDQRLADLEKARQAGDKDVLETPPSPRYAQEMVSYGDCMTCKRKVNRNDLFMPTICADCRALLEWICEQLGDPKEAMQTLYNALSVYFDVIRQEKREQAMQQQALQQQQPQLQTYNPQPVTQSQNEQDLTSEDLQLLKKIKMLKELGVL